MNDMKFINKSNVFDKPLSYEEMLEITKYIETQGCDIVIYKDYIEASKIIGRNINDRGVKFPRNLMEQHDQVMTLKDKKQKKVINEKIRRVAKLLKGFDLKSGELKIVFPKSQNDLVKWGNKLHNCVGTMGYGKKMGIGNCLILGIFKDGKIVECCELQAKNEDSKKLKIIQLRGDHNQPSQYHLLAERLVNRFTRKYSSKQIVGACA